ncbi:hypothetical protein DDE73_28800 (plasmid) [Bacillus thuringiensis]|nr:hypothetical protein DDE73_28800 [Bacillus thuringiensis]
MEQVPRSGTPSKYKDWKRHSVVTQRDVQYCSIGSVKSNIGHAESAAGIGGLHKVILQLHHRTLVPSLHSSEPNPHIDFARSPFYVQQKTEVWKRPILKGAWRGKRISTQSRN